LLHVVSWLLMSRWVPSQYSRYTSVAWDQGMILLCDCLESALSSIVKWVTRWVNKIYNRISEC
jgi:hypothetical protein